MNRFRTICTLITLLALAASPGLLLAQGDTEALEEHMRQVRRKIEQAGGENLIQTMRGVGYKLIDEKP